MSKQFSFTSCGCRHVHGFGHFQSFSRSVSAARFNISKKFIKIFISLFCSIFSKKAWFGRLFWSLFCVYFNSQNVLGVPILASFLEIVELRSRCVISLKLRLTATVEILVQNEESDPGTRFVPRLSRVFLFWVRYFYDDIEPGLNMNLEISDDNFKSSKAPLILVWREDFIKIHLENTVFYDTLQAFLSSHFS